MNFTPQQLAGSGKYNSRVLIGNWNEDLALSDLKSKQAAWKREQGERIVDKSKSSTKAGSTPVSLSYSPDGFVRFGDVVGLSHGKTNQNLAVNLNEKVDGSIPGLRLFQTSGVKVESIRSAFMIMLAPGMPDKEFVEYGDEILLATHPAHRVDARSGLCQNQFYLMSAPATVLGSRTSSNEQLACMAQVLSKCNTSYLRWRIEPPSGKLPHSVLQEKRVVASEPVVLIHCATGQALAMDSPFVVYNNYGQELETFCCLDKATRKVHVLKAEHKGHRAPDHRIALQARNVWHIEMAQDANNAFCEENTRFITPETVVELVREQIQSRGSGGIEQLEEILRALDEEKDGVIQLVQLKWGLLDWGLDISEDELSCLLSLFDPSQGVSIQHFVELIR